MSANIGVVRRVYERIRAADVEGGLEEIDSGVEFSSFLTDVHGGSYRGHRGVRDWQRDLREAFEHYDPEPALYEDYGDLVLVTGTIHLRGTGSRVPVEQPYVGAMGVAEGRIAWWRTYRSREEAISAHGLARREPLAIEEA